jgi:predicted lipid carrier protein YhbT
MSISTLPRVPSAVGLALRPLPIFPLQLPLAAFVRSVHRRHPGIFERLGPYADKRYGIDPTDLPFAFVLKPRRATPRAIAVRELPRDVDVRAAGPIAGLVGSRDGDALFFSRELVIEGDIEAVLALRNAVDDAGIDMAAEVAAWFGPLAPAARTVLRVLLAPGAAGAREAAPRTERRAWS